ncbi:HNH endonuclease [Mesorhizobium sp.]|uniref:HNH endonuclease n=1 Tax=Mesorhizobium sp. TaxID=1871066 RepID=UPI000FE6E3FC|nr:HNH endonuclease [Mesorhizobium sp.]RWF34798.1 MAG: HNH endonuclease [Mesorhizobium sp.]
MNNFVFLNLPENYRLVDALADGKNELWWRTTLLKQKIAMGDRVFLWQGKGGQEIYRGVHAIAEVIERPRLLQFEEFDNYWVDDGEKAVQDEHTRLRIVERAEHGGHLRQNVILQSTILRDRGVFSGARGINFNLTEKEAEELVRLWHEHAGVVVDPTPDQQLVPVANDPEDKNDETARDMLERAATSLLGKSPAELEALLAKPKKERDGKLLPIKVAGRARDPVVIAYARIRASNACEVDGCTIPLFVTSNGVPFVEVHHIHPLGKGGADSINNVACVCPSHHREAHHGKRADAIQAELTKLRSS